jgi:cysteine desulfurase
MQDFDVKYVGVDQFGVVNLEQLERLVDKSTILVSVMHANNETGTISRSARSPISLIGEERSFTRMPLRRSAS